MKTNAENHAKYREKRNQYSKDYRKKNLGKLVKQNKQYRAKYPDMVRNSHLKRKFGITIEDYDSLLEKQKNCCAICGLHALEFKRRLAVDHNHDTGEIRGLLCDNCNQAIGKLKDNVNNLKNAIVYLEAKKIRGENG